MKKYLFFIVAYFLFIPIAMSIEVGEVAPDFVGRDINGDDTLISDYRGQVVVLLFWINDISKNRNGFTADISGQAGDIANNHNLLNGLSAISNFLNQRGGGNSVKLIASSSHGPFYKFRRDIRNIKNELDVHYTNDRGARISAKYFNRNLHRPVTFVINQQGKIAYRYNLFSKDLVDKISDNINSLLKQD